MTRPAPARRPGRARRAAPPDAPVGPDLATALARLRAVFGPVEVVEVRAHQPQPGQAPEAAPAQGRLLDREAAG
jgi:hypothetical protein